MLTKLILRNFQKHRKLVIKFDRHVTTIVGKNDAGKSAALRALRWVCLNRPSGKSFIRTGAKSTSVRAVVDSKELQRIVGTRNVYKLDGAIYKSFRSEVPQAITKLLKVDEINFQRQHESHFWFGLTPGATAKELNKLVDLDTIDKVQQALAADLRKLRTELELTSRQRVESASVVARLGWTVSALSKISHISGLFRQYGTSRTRIDSLASATQDGTRTARRASNAVVLLSVAQTAHIAAGRLAELRDRITGLKAVYGAAVRSGGALWADLPDITGLADLRGRLERLQDRLLAADDLELHWAECDGNVRQTKKKLEQKLGGRCPVCGGFLSDKSLI